MNELGVEFEVELQIIYAVDTIIYIVFALAVELVFLLQNDLVESWRLELLLGWFFS